MIDLITRRFEAVVKNLDELYSLDFSPKQSLNNLKEIKNKIEKFAYSETSNLNIFDEMLRSFLDIKGGFYRNRNDNEEEELFNKTKIAPYIYKSLYRDLTDVLSNNFTNKNFPYYDYKKYYFNSDPTVSLSSVLIVPDIIGQKDFFESRRFNIEDLIDASDIKKTTKVTKENLISSIESDLYTIEKFINDICFITSK